MAIKKKVKKVKKDKVIISDIGKRKKVIVSEKVQKMIDAKGSYLDCLSNNNNSHPHWTSRGISICGNCYSTFSREIMLKIKIKDTQAEIRKLEKAYKGDEPTDSNLQKQCNYLNSHISNLESTQTEMIVADHFYKMINEGDSYILPTPKNTTGIIKTFTSSEIAKVMKKAESLTKTH